MADIYWGLTVIGSLAVSVFLLAYWLGRRLPRRLGNAAALIVVLALFAYIQFLWYNTRLVHCLPLSNVIVTGNWFPLAAGALGGLAWHRIPGRCLRRGMFVGGLSGASIYSVCYPLLGAVPQCTDMWQREICLQSTTKTCTPACAATLLRSHGISATEEEMARLCLTRAGTTWMGLYRGLKLKTAGTGWDVDVVSCDADELLTMHAGPMILCVGLPPGKRLDDQPLNLTGWGWMHGVGHSVVLLRPTSHGRVLIADPMPSVGSEEWTRMDVKYLYRGTAVRLVKRS
jgi:hypothetical protein